MSDRLDVLSKSVAHLRDVASGLDPSRYTSPAYPTAWTIADTFSHLGSGAVIGQRWFEDSVAQRGADPSFNTSVWDEWNAKDPANQVADSLASDAALLAALGAATEDQRNAFRLALGPFSFDFDGMVGLRLSEHVLHSWDVEVPDKPDATLSSEAADAILDGIQFVVARSAKPTGEPRNVAIRTVDPQRDFTLILGPESAALEEASFNGAPDIELPAESLVRLIYGRLDEEHTPENVTGEALDGLRKTFLGF